MSTRRVAHGTIRRVDPVTAHYLPWVAGVSLAGVTALGILSRWVLVPIERRHRAHLLARPAMDWEEVAPRISSGGGAHERRARAAMLLDEVETYAPKVDHVVATIGDLVSILAASPEFRRQSAELERRLRLHWTS